MEAHLAPKQPTQVNKITSSCEIYSGPHDTQYCMENHEQTFVDYGSSYIDKREASGTLSNLSKTTLVTPIILHVKVTQTLGGGNPKILKTIFQTHLIGSFPNRSFNNNPQNFNNQSNLEGMVSNFMASQDARLSKFEADFKQQQSKMTNKIDTVLKAITDRIMGALPSDIIKNPKLNVNSTSPVLSGRSYLMEDPNSINAIKTCSNQHNENDQSKIKTLMVNEIRTPRSKEPEQTIEDEFKDLHLNLLVLES
ncbi:hypothetical protein Tco_0732032 [Tanacetum coccineum]